MPNKKLPEFKGKCISFPLEVGPLIYNTFGKEVVTRVNEKYKGTPAEIFPPKEGEIITNSNTFRLFAIDSVVRDLGARVMLPEELWLLLSQKILPEKKITDYGGHLYDLGLCLDFIKDHHHESAIALYNQLPEKDLSLLPAMVLGLKLRKNDEMYCDLEFIYGINSQMRNSTILTSWGGWFKNNDSELTRTGLPSKLNSKKNNRIFSVGESYFRESDRCIDNLGISRFDYIIYPHDQLFINTGHVNLYASNDESSIVIVKR